MIIKRLLVVTVGCLAQSVLLSAGEIEPTWESMAENYKVPEWFQDGKIGVWMHWGIPSAIDENRPNDGSHYGRRMYGDIGTITLLGSDETLKWERSAEALTIQLPKTLPDQPVIGFRITSASAQQRAARYPKFSWGKVPVAFHFGKHSSIMTEAEARFVASRSNFICLEKRHAAKQFGDTETGIEKEAQQLKKLNPDMKNNIK